MNRRILRLLFHPVFRRSRIVSQSRALICTTYNKSAIKTKTGLALDLSTQYKKYDLREHVLARPDMYVGTKEICERLEWVFEEDHMEQKKLTYPPALLKIFDEILVNAADNKQRSPSMTEIRVTIDRELGSIKIWNDGTGLPIREHPIEHVPIPTFIFGYPMVSSHHDDSKIRIVGGRNGYGAKVCNILSSRFQVRTGSEADGKLFEQTWLNNMETRQPEIISPYEGRDFTEITFEPDFAWFGVDGLNDDIFQLFHRRVIDIAGTLRDVNVYFQGEHIKMNYFLDYVNLYIPNGTPIHRQHPNKRWEVIIVPSKENSFQQRSFVNNIDTAKGGRHVDHVVSQVVKAVQESLEARGKKGIRAPPIKAQFWIFINALIENPAFEAQTKDELTTEIRKFGSKFELNAQALDEWVEECGIIDALLGINGKTKTRRPADTIIQDDRLDDANWAGTGRSQKCTLIVTEGESAKALAMAGIEVVGRNAYGALPIRGLLINPNDTADEKVFANQEVISICSALGLDRECDYRNVEDQKKLRYGRVLFFMDADEDGAHVKGLLLNLFQHYWPGLLQNGFFASFITPLIKARRGDKEISFFSRQEFNKWCEMTPGSNLYSVKYYKGLGTSTSKEARQYFKNLERHTVPFRWEQGDDEKIEMAFKAKCAANRKSWIRERNANESPEIPLEEKVNNGITYSQFIDNELYEFSLVNLKRAIPSVIDGLKPSQRKILYTCLRDRKKEWKVAQLAGIVAQLQAYHHGERSLEEAIVSMAQNFVGARNFPLLLPIGQFGTRAKGGEDAASARYIFTQLSPLASRLFPQADEPSYVLVEEESQLAEPEWLCPVIPTVLLNGCEGIATGWSTKVLPYKPRDIIDNVRRLIQGNEIQIMTPWFRNFKGDVRFDPSENKLDVIGNLTIKKKDPTTMSARITELPIGAWTKVYKEKKLSELLKKKVISNLSENHTEHQVDFEFDLSPLSCNDIDLRKATQKGLIKLLKLSSSLSTNNMILFNSSKIIQSYPTTESIFKDHFNERRRFYEERIERETKRLALKMRTLNNQWRFVKGVVEKQIDPHDNNIALRLIESGFESDPQKAAKNNNDKAYDFGYLFKLPIEKLRSEEILKLEDEVAKLKAAHQQISSTSFSNLWLQELDQLETEFKALDPKSMDM